MSYLYVTEQGSSLCIKGGRIEVRKKEELIRSIPVETLESIQIFGAVNVTTPCIEYCLKKGINLVYYSRNGCYYGRLISPSHVNAGRQRKQAALNEKTDFGLKLSKRIIHSKIHNQIVILRRYSRHQNSNVESAILAMKNSIRELENCRTVSQIMGYEGIAARSYFHALGELIVPEFAFSGRTRRPPEDAFNSMISLGYSILLNEIVGKLEAKGLNPYFGILHSDRENHPTLGSDLMEEWRAVIIDSLAMSLANGHEIRQEAFYASAEDSEKPGVYLTNEGFKVFVRKLESKLTADNRYLDYVEYPVSFRRAIDLQTSSFIRSLELDDPTQYHPVMIR